MATLMRNERRLARAHRVTRAQRTQRRSGGMLLLLQKNHIYDMIVPTLLLSSGRRTVRAGERCSVPGA